MGTEMTLVLLDMAIENIKEIKTTTNYHFINKN